MSVNRMTAAEVAAALEAEAERRRTKRRRSAGPSRLEQVLAADLADRGLTFRREYHFKPAGRRQPWRFDFAFPELMLAVEVEGGTWTAGRHNRGKDFERDCVKYNAAALHGWAVLRFTCDQIDSGYAGEQIAEAVAERSSSWPSE